MGTRALAVLLLVPSLAVAQTVTIDDPEISRSECSGTTSRTVTFTISLTGTFPATSQYRLFAQAGSCSSTTLPSVTPLATKTAADTSTQTLTTTADAIRQAIGVAATCDSPSDVSYYLCVYLVDTSSGGGGIAGTASGGSQMFQLAIPPMPSISVAPGNQALDVAVTPGTADATYKATASVSYEALATPVGGGTTVSSGRGGVGDTTLRIDGLVNNQPYDVVARAYSSALNPGPDSTPAVQGTPLPFASFWEAYQNAGGREQGGCGGGAGALSILALLPLALRRRRP